MHSVKVQEPVHYPRYSHWSCWSSFSTSSSRTWYRTESTFWITGAQWCPSIDSISTYIKNTPKCTVAMCHVILFPFAFKCPNYSAEIIIFLPGFILKVKMSQSLNIYDYSTLFLVKYMQNSKQYNTKNVTFCSCFSKVSYIFCSAVSYQYLCQWQITDCFVFVIYIVNLHVFAHDI